jgi:hypothetical protein
VQKPVVQFRGRLPPGQFAAPSATSQNHWLDQHHRQAPTNPLNGLYCLLNLDSHQLRIPSGLAQRFHDVLGREFAHDQGLIASRGCLHGFSIEPLNIFSAASTTTVHFHDKFCAIHNLPIRFAIPVEEGIAVRRRTNCPVADFSLRAVIGFPLDGLYVFGLEALRALGDGKFYGLAFMQAAESVCLDCRKMHENIISRLPADKAEALGIVKPLHCSLFHSCYLFCIREFLLRRIAASEAGRRYCGTNYQMRVFELS